MVGTIKLLVFKFMKMRKYLSAIMLLAAPWLFMSCIKDDLVKLTDHGDSYISFNSDTESMLFFKAFTDVKKIQLLDVRRDVPSEAILNTTSTVKLTAVPELIEEYNEEHDSDYEWLDPAIFTFVPASGVTLSGNDFTLAYNAGDFAKNISINLDGAKWDLSKKYAVAYKVTDPGNLKVSGDDHVIVFINARNDYDGVYKILDGFVQRYSNPTTPTVDDALNGTMVGNPDVFLSTISPTTVEITNLRWFGGTSGVGGIDNLRVTVDPATNKLTVFALGNGTVKIIEGEDNYYDPATRTFVLNFDWNQTANKRVIGNLKIQWSQDQ